MGVAWRLLLPFAVFALATLTAALHRLLGEPLGPAATVKLADLWQTMAAMLVVYTPVLGHYRRQEHALASRPGELPAPHREGNPPP